MYSFLRQRENAISFHKYNQDDPEETTRNWLGLRIGPSEHDGLQNMSEFQTYNRGLIRQELSSKFLYQGMDMRSCPLSLSERTILYNNLSVIILLFCAATR